MASPGKSGGGSIILKLLILVLIVVLGYSVYSPKKQWVKQDGDLELARERMDNLYNAGNIFIHFNKRWPNTIDEMVSALDTTVVEADPFAFTIERKQNMDLVAERQDLEAMEVRSSEEDARLTDLVVLLRDSLLITLDDTMRIDQFVVEDLGQQSYFYGDLEMDEEADEELDEEFGEELDHDYFTTLIYAKMKPLYQGLGSDTLYLLSEQPIRVLKRHETSISRELWASTQGDFKKRPDDAWFAKGPVVKQPVRNFSFTLPMDELNECPATGKPFEVKHVAKYSYKGAYLFAVAGEEGEALETTARKQAFLNEVKGLASQEIGAIFSAMTDSANAAGMTAFRVPDDIQQEVIVEKSLAAAAKLREGQEVLAESDNTTIAGIDSLAFFTNPDLRETTLFAEFDRKSKTAKHFDILMQAPEIQSLLEGVRVTPEFEEVKVDTIGLAIYSPIVGDESYLSGWQSIFEVAPPENHGGIYNGTRSWE